METKVSPLTPYEQAFSAKFEQYTTAVDAKLETKPNYAIGNEYATYLRPLSEDMLYFYLNENGIDTSKALINAYEKNAAAPYTQYQNSHYCVRYIDAEGKLQEKYYDYVTCDQYGNSMFQNYNNDPTPNKASEIAGINLVYKVPTYKDLEGNTTTTFTYYTAEERANLTTAEKNLYNKKKVVDGQEFYVSQRIGWE